MSEIDSSDPNLVMAIPRRETYGIQGFTVAMSIELLESIQHESWYALLPDVRNDSDAKELRVSFLIRHKDEFLVREDGVLLLSSPICVEDMPNSSLGSIRNCVHDRVSQVVTPEQRNGRPLLIGTLNMDADESLRPYCTLVYEAVMKSRKSIEGYSWIGVKYLADTPLDPASVHCVDILKEKYADSAA